MRATSRSHRITASLLAAPLVLAGLAFTTPEGCYTVTPDDPATVDVDETVVACQHDTWIADPSGTKAGNVATQGQTDYPTFSDEEPTASVTDGAGAGYLGTSLLQLAEDDPDLTGFTITGEFTGVVDSMAVTLHGVHTGFGKLPFSPTGPVPPENPNPTAPVEQAPMTAYVSVDIDGLAVVPIQTLEVDFLTDAAPTANASERYRINLTDIAAAMDDWDIDLGPDTVHTVTLRVTPRYINTDPAVVFLYGTSEVPSSVVFNPLTLDADVPTYDVF